MERIAARPAAINMRINAAPRVSAPRAETFRSIKTGESIKLGAFSPTISVPKESSVRRSSFNSTIPFIPSVEQKSFAPVKDTPEKSVVVAENQHTKSIAEFGRFLPNPQELTFVKPTKKASLPIFDTTVSVRPEKPMRHDNSQNRNMIAVPNGEKSVTLPKNSNNESYTKNISSDIRIAAIRTELQTLIKEPTNNLVAPVQKPTEVIVPVPTMKKAKVETIDEQTIQQRVAILYKEKGLVGALQQLKTEVTTVPEITLLRAVHVVVEQQVKEQRLLQLKRIIQPEVIKKKDQEVFLTYSMVPPEKKTMNEETKQQIVIDEKVMVARQLVVIGAVLQRYLFQEIVSGNAEYILSGKDLASDLPQKATDNLISGLAAMRGTEDGSYEMWKQKIAALPQSNMFDIMTSAVGLISTALPVTVAESGKKASPDAISLVLGLTPLTDITTR